MPRVVGPWTTIAGNPDLGPLNGPPAENPNHRQEPVDFGIDDKADDKFVCLLEVAAPETVFHDGRCYIAALLPDIQGIRIAPLAWVPDNVNR